MADRTMLTTHRLMTAIPITVAATSRKAAATYRPAAEGFIRPGTIAIFPSVIAGMLAATDKTAPAIYFWSASICRRFSVATRSGDKSPHSKSRRHFIGLIFLFGLVTERLGVVPHANTRGGCLIR